MSTINLESELTCPNCGYTKQESMPTNACQFYFACINCKMLLRPRPATAACSAPMALCLAYRLRKPINLGPQPEAVVQESDDDV